MVMTCKLTNLLVNSMYYKGTYLIHIAYLKV